MTYDPDRFDAEIILDRTGHTDFTAEVVAEILGVSESCIRTRLKRGYYDRPAIEDAAIGGFIDGGNWGGGHVRKHRWSREQVIDMMLKGDPLRGRVPRKEIEHGTIRGYWAHERHKVPYCDPCRAAHNEYEREGRRKKVAA